MPHLAEQLLMILGLMLFGFGLMFLLEDRPWWHRLGGVLLLAAVLVSTVVVVLYLRRPVAPREVRPNAADESAAAAWASTLGREGVISLPLSRGTLVKTFGGIAFMAGVAVLLVLLVEGVFGLILGALAAAMAFFLAFLPHIEFVTAEGPALRVDRRGIRIARWGGLEIPWEEIEEIYAHNSVGQVNLTISVSQTFYRNYLTRRFLLLRPLDWLTLKMIGPGFSVPSTTKADAIPLTLWLIQEFDQRNPSPPLA